MWKNNEIKPNIQNNEEFSSIPKETKEESEEFEKKQIKQNELKLHIINDIVNLKGKIDEYKKLSIDNKNIDKSKIMLELMNIKKYFQDIIWIAKQYLKNEFSITEDSELNKRNWFIDKEKSVMMEIDKVDDEVLSVFLLIELFKLDWFGDFRDIRTFLSEESKANLNTNVQKMKQFDANDTDVTWLMNELSNHWKTTYEANDWVSEWPILVIFPEAHYSWPILKNNFDAVINTKEYYNFLATEWANNNQEINEKMLKLELLWNQLHRKEITQEQYNELVKNNNWYITQEINNLFTENKIPISSLAIEAVLKQQIKTLWVEPNDLWIISWKASQRSKDSSQKILENVKEKSKEWMTYWEYFNPILNDKQSDFLENVILKYRNYFWLKNIQWELIKWTNDWKNFVPIVCWAMHAQDLIAQSKNMWFKWVIRFEPKAFNEKMDIWAAENYFKNQ
jgi:hypothetical protein